MGLAQLAAGSPTKAERSFGQVTSSWPDDPLSVQCWIEIGNAASKRQSHLEALEAYRSAIRVAAPGAVKTQASLGMGKTLSTIGANKEALEILTQCATQDPEAALKNMDLVRALGEAFFAMKQYDRSREYLLRWLNLQTGEHEKDLVLAKIAENSLIQGDWAMANSFYSYIRKHYPDSEGDYICKIRKAEILEKDPAGFDEAEAVYVELSRKKLSPSLRKIVNVKMALLLQKNGNPEKSLEMLNQIIDAEPDCAGQEEIASLREHVVNDLAVKYAAHKNYPVLIQLHQNFPGAFKGVQPTELMETIAEAYGTLGFPGNAFELYEALAARKKSEEWLLKCAYYAYESGKFDRAVAYCGQVQAPDLDSRKAGILGRVNFRDGKYGEAAKYLARVFQQNPKEAAADPVLVGCYAKSLIEIKKYDEALPVLQQGLESLAHDNIYQRYGFLSMTGKCQVELKQYQSAIETFESAVRCCTGDQANGIIYDISRVYVALGQQDKALQALSRLAGSSQGFWKAAAQQQVNSVQMVSGGK